MNTSVKISVILPVHNQDQFLAECLDSLLAQTMDDFEVLCVDSGCSDRSVDILEAYRKTDPRIRILHQSHRGIGFARNQGIRHASGEYLLFLDADDYLEEDALRKLSEKADADQADLCVCGGKQYLQEQETEVPADMYLNRKRLPEKLPFCLEDAPRTILNFTTESTLNKLFRHGFVLKHCLQFAESDSACEVPFVLPALCLAERISVVRDVLACERRVSDDISIRALLEDPAGVISQWAVAKEKLDRAGVLPEQSYANKAVSGILAQLRNLSQSPAVFYSSVKWLQEEGLAKIGVKEQEEGYYNSSVLSDGIRHLMHDTPEEYLSYSLHLASRQLNEANVRRQLQAKKTREAQTNYRLWTETSRKTQDYLTAENQRLNEQLAAERAKVRELETQLKELKTEASRSVLSGLFRRKQG